MTSKECLKRIDERNYLTQRERKDFLNVVEEDLDQLEEYRKIEKEIGVDFVTLVKMLKDDVYINDAGIVGEIGNIYKERVKSIEHWPVWGFSADGVEYAFNERGRTWALSKEEFYETLSKQKN